MTGQPIITHRQFERIAAKETAVYFFRTHTAKFINCKNLEAFNYLVDNVTENFNNLMCRRKQPVISKNLRQSMYWNRTFKTVYFFDFNPALLTQIEWKLKLNSFRFVPKSERNVEVDDCLENISYDVYTTKDIQVRITRREHDQRRAFGNSCEQRLFGDISYINGQSCKKMPVCTAKGSYKLIAEQTKLIKLLKCDMGLTEVRPMDICVIRTKQGKFKFKFKFKIECLSDTNYRQYYLDSTLFRKITAYYIYKGYSKSST